MTLMLLRMERPQIEDYNINTYDGALGYIKDLETYLDYLEDIGEHKKI